MLINIKMPTISNKSSIIFYLYSRNVKNIINNFLSFRLKSYDEVVSVVTRALSLHILVNN